MKYILIGIASLLCPLGIIFLLRLCGHNPETLECGLIGLSCGLIAAFSVW